MKVTHFCTYSIGGAAIAAIRLHRLLLALGIESKLIFLYKNDCSEPATYDFRDSLSLIQKLKLKISNKLLKNRNHRQLCKYGIPPEYFSFPNNVWDISRHPFVKDSDIIHLHWVAGFFDVQNLYSKIFTHKQIVWTLHDMQPFSGGFHFTTWFNTNPWQTLIEKNKTYLASFAQQKPIHFICPSQWMKVQALKESIFSNHQHEILNNPCSDNFYSIERAQAIEKLKLDPDVNYCFVPADDANYARKGIQLIENILMRQKFKYTFIVSGNRPLNAGNNKQIYIGKIDNEKMLNLYYNICDVILFSSVAENYSNTLREAKLCGCPVIAFNVGGNREILSSETGDILLPEISEEMLSEALIRFQKGFNNRQPSSFSKSVTSSTNMDYAKKFVDFYTRILNRVT